MSAIALQKALQLVFAQQKEQDNGTSPDHSTSTAAASTQAVPVDGSQGPKLDAAATEDQTQRDSWACASSPALVDPLPGETRSLGNITAGQQAKKRRGSVQAAPSAKRLAVKGGSTAKPATAATPGQQASNKQDQKVAGLKPAAGGPSTGARQPSAPKPRSTQGRGQGPKGIGTGGKPAGPAATDLPTKTAHPNIKVRDDGKFRVFLSSQGLKYLHMGQYADYDKAMQARDLAVLAVHGAERMSTIKPLATYSKDDIAAVRVQMAQRPTAKAVMEANGLWPLKAGTSSSTLGGLAAAAAAAGEQQVPLSPIKRFKGLQYHLPTGGSALAGKRGLAAAAAVGVAGVLAAKCLPMKKVGAKPASSSKQQLQQPPLLPVAERAQHAAKTGSEEAGAVVAAAAAGAGGMQPASPPRISRRAAAAGVFAAVVAAGGGSKTPPRHQIAAGEAAAAHAASALAAVAASLQHAKGVSGSSGLAAAAALQPVRASLQPAVKARNKVSAAAAAAARARAKAAAPAAKQAQAAAAVAAAASLLRLQGGVAGSREHHARAIANPTGAAGIREHRGVFEVFLSTPPFRYLYVGRAASLQEAERMKQVALLAVYGRQAPGQQQQQPQPLLSRNTSGASDILDSDVQDMAVRLSAKAPAWEAMQRFGTAALVPAHLQPKAGPLLPTATAKPGRGRGRPPKPCAAQQPQQQAQQVAAAEGVGAAAAQQQQQQQGPAVVKQEPSKQLAVQQVKPSCRDPRRRQQQLQQQEGRQAAQVCASTTQQQVQQAKGHLGGQQQQPHKEHEVRPDADGTGAAGTPGACAARACRAAAAAGVAAVALAVAGEGDESDSSEADLSGFESDEWGFSQHALAGRLKSGHKRRQRVQGSRPASSKALKQQPAAGAAAAPGRAPAGVCSRPLSLCERLQAYAATARSKDSASAGAGSGAAADATLAAGTARQQAPTVSRAFDAADPDPMAAVDALEAELASLDNSRCTKLLPSGGDSHAAAAGASTAAAGAGAAAGGKASRPGRPRKSTATAGAAAASASACEVKPGRQQQRGKQGWAHSSQPAARVLSQLPLQALLQQHNKALLQQQQLLRLQAQNAKASQQQQQQLVLLQMRPEAAMAQQQQQQQQQQQGQAARVQLVQGLQTLVQQQQQPMQLRMLQIPVLVCQPAGAFLAAAQQSQLLAAGQASLQQQLLLFAQQQQQQQAPSATHSTSNPPAEGPVAAATGAAEQGCAADRTCAVASSKAAAAATPEPSVQAAAADRHTEASPVTGSPLRTPDSGAAVSPVGSLATGPAADSERAVDAAAPEMMPGAPAAAAALDAAAPEVMPGAAAGAAAAELAAKRARSSSSDCPQPSSSASDPAPIAVAASPGGGEAGTAAAAGSLGAQHPAGTAEAEADAAARVMGGVQQP